MSTKRKREALNKMWMVDKSVVCVKAINLGDVRREEKCLEAVSRQEQSHQLITRVMPLDLLYFKVLKNFTSSTWFIGLV